MRDPLERFGYAWGASGVLNFFGQGYPFHETLKRWFDGFDFRKVTFVAKSMTTLPKAGNMPIDADLMPTERRPRCIKASFWHAATLNAVGLTNPGAEALFATGKWQTAASPLFISFAPQGTTAEERLSDTMSFMEIAKRRIPQFHALVGLQLNVTCPNTGEDVTDGGALAEEAIALLTALIPLGIPIVVKANVLLPPQAARTITDHPACAGITVSNAIPWMALPALGIDRARIFGSDISPLAEFGGGGLSGRPLLPYVAQWVRDARKAGIKKHINAGGGIMRPQDVFRLKEAGASSISIGCMAILRPWRVEDTAYAACEAFGWGQGNGR